METVAFTCRRCGFSVWVPVASLSKTEVGLYDDARFPGRCLVVLREHEEAFELLDEYVATAFIKDVRRVGRAIRHITRSPRINFAILGNVEPHLHAHVIPRMVGSDPVPESAPWQSPIGHSKLEGTERERLRSRLGKMLDSDW